MGSKTYSTSIDTWSCGCIFAEMIQGSALFRGRDNQDQLNRIMRVIGSPSTDVVRKLISDSPEITIRQLAFFPKVHWQTVVKNGSLYALDLLDRLLQFEPSARITPADALHHDYFAGHNHLPTAAGQMAPAPVQVAPQAGYAHPQMMAPPQAQMMAGPPMYVQQPMYYAAAPPPQNYGQAYAYQQPTHPPAQQHHAGYVYYPAPQ